MPPTQRQKQFLRALGHKEFDKLTKESASTLIDRLLDEERASGKTFPCPYCKQKFGPRPKRTKKCPNCGNTIVHLSGRFYTADKLEEMNQKEWFKDSRADNKTNVREDWKDERQFRKEFGEAYTVGYLIKVGSACSSTADLNGTLVLIEDAHNAIELLPPYESCRHDTCECEYEPVSAHEVPKGTRVAEFVEPEKQAMLEKSRHVATKRASNKSGCLGAILGIIAVAAVLFGWWESFG